MALWSHVWFIFEKLGAPLPHFCVLIGESWHNRDHKVFPKVIISPTRLMFADFLIASLQMLKSFLLNVGLHGANKPPLPQETHKALKRLASPLGWPAPK